MRGMRCVLRAESVTWFPSLGGEDFMAEAIGGFGPFRVVRICTDLVASTGHAVSERRRVNFWFSAYCLGPARPIVRICIGEQNREDRDVGNFEVELFETSDWLMAISILATRTRVRRPPRSGRLCNIHVNVSHCM